MGVRAEVGTPAAATAAAAAAIAAAAAAAAVLEPSGFLSIRLHYYYVFVMLDGKRSKDERKIKQKTE